MVIFDENNKSIQIKRSFSKSTTVPHAKFYIRKKVIFFENFDYQATIMGKETELKKIYHNCGVEGLNIGEGIHDIL